jgi:hypothetical protein
MKEGSDTVIALLQMQRNQIAICWMVNRAAAAFLTVRAAISRNAK